MMRQSVYKSYISMEAPVFTGASLLTGPMEADQYILSQLLEDAVNSMCVIRLYPGLRSAYLIVLMDMGVKNFFLELYDTGTAGFREGPYSLKRVFSLGKRRGIRFYRTSQQEGLWIFPAMMQHHGNCGGKERFQWAPVPRRPLWPVILRRASLPTARKSWPPSWKARP
ncbi:MAG: hypothetical protein LBU18_04320 [Treponema sp.]|nr:hypothetical protein [Treponema sp.]